MVISYDGIESVKISQGDITFAFNPPSKKSKFASTSFGSDVVLISVNHPDLNGSDTATRNDQIPFVINGPGEYEIKGFAVSGFPTKTNYGGEERINTVYKTQIDGISVAFLGALSEKELSAEIKEEIADIDIFFVPIGGDGVLEPEEAYTLAVKREPKIIIPIHYGDVGRKDALKRFLKEAGEEDLKPVDKLTIKRKDLDGKEGQIIILR